MHRRTGTKNEDPLGRVSPSPAQDIEPASNHLLGTTRRIHSEWMLSSLQRLTTDVGCVVGHATCSMSYLGIGMDNGAFFI